VPNGKDWLEYVREDLQQRVPFTCCLETFNCGANQRVFTQQRSKDRCHFDPE